MGTLSDLKRIKKEIDAHTAKEAQAKAERDLKAKRLAAQKNLFQTAVGKVKRLPETVVVNLKPTPPQPAPLQHQRDEAAALQESLSDEVDVSSLLDTDDHLSFRRPGENKNGHRCLTKS